MGQASRAALLRGGLLLTGPSSSSGMLVSEVRALLKCVRGSTQHGRKPSLRFPHLPRSPVGSRARMRSDIGIHTIVIPDLETGQAPPGPESVLCSQPGSWQTASMLLPSGSKTYAP